MPKDLGIFETRPLCVRCEVVMTCHKNDVLVARYQRDMPTAMAHADEFRCPTCRGRIIVGYGRKVKVNLEEIEQAEREGLLRRVVAIA